MKKFFFYPLLLAFIAGIVAGANYTPGTFLSGWDTLHPEFNFPLAFSRILTGVWRADQGLGAVAIQSHMADLPRVLLLFLGSFLMPINLLRYASFLITLAVGPVGIYYLAEHLLKKQHGPHKHFIAFFSALTYFFNLGTVQHFIVPLEMFAFHYALLPWLLLTGLLVLESWSRKAFLAFAMITLAASPQAHTATLFYAYFSVFTLFISAFILSADQKIRALKRGAALIAATLFLNAYWLLPNVYAVVTKSDAVRTSKVNTLFSNEAFAKNQKFGIIADAALIKNFLFDWQLIDPKTNAQIDIMAAWSDHLTRHPVALVYGYTVFVLVWTGFVYALWKKQRTLLTVTPILIIPFLMLLNGTWPMTLVLARMKESAPVLGEAMRFPFTKFSILYMAASSLFAGVGLLQFFRLIKQVSVIRITKAVVVVLSFYYFLPAFSGNLVHPAMRVRIPQEYFNAFSWFQKQNPDRRVAILPVFSFWNWVNYSWGYQGAGFLQFGIPQPILDRDYDRWSPFNENYYWELSQALYSKDATKFDAVLNKYDVHYLFLDENVISREHNRSLFIDETKALIAQIPTITVARSFGKITVYERGIPKQVRDDNLFVSLKSNLPTVSPAYAWTDNDVAYRELGDYVTNEIASPRQPAGTRNDTSTYPFRSLFTKRSVSEREFTIEENEERLLLRSRPLAGFPVFFEEGNVHEQKNDEKQGVSNTDFDIDIHPINHTRLSNETATPNDTIPPKKLIVNGSTLRDTSSKNIFGKISIVPNQPADKLVNNPETTRNQDFFNRFDITTSVTKDGTVVNATIPKADALAFEATNSAILNPAAVVPCGIAGKGTATAATIISSPDQFLRFTSQNQRGCLSFDISQLPHKDSYLVTVESRHVTGRPLLLAFINDTAKHAETEAYLAGKTDYFILPPLASDGLGYTVYLSNDAIGPASAKASAGKRQETINDIKSIKFYRIPYQELVSLQLQPQGRALSVDMSRNVIVSHPNPAYYKIVYSQKSGVQSENAPRSTLSTLPSTLIVSQVFDLGWVAFTRITTFPFFQPIKDHVLVNNWANGWTLPDTLSTMNDEPITVLLFFWPQLLEWLGFLLLPIPFILPFLPRIFRRH